MDTDRLAALLKNGLLDPANEDQIDFRYILVGVSLAGCCSVWLVGTKAVLEIGHFQGAQPDVTWEEFFGKKKYTRADFVKMGMEKRTWDKAVDAYQEPAILPLAFQKRVRKPYSWTLKVIGGDIASLWLKTFDGQATPVDPKTGQTLLKQMTVPKELKVSWHANNGSKCVATATMHEEEIFQVFTQLQALSPTDPLQVQVELGRSSSAIAISVQSKKLVVPLSKVRLN